MIELFALVTLGVVGLAAGGSAQAEAEALPETCYLFSYFTGNGEDGLHLAWSRDGYEWQVLNGGESYLRPQVGESKLMRDPCITRGPDGTFHMVWTTSWGGQTIGYASSRDLIHWSPQQAIPVMAHEPGVRNCWAPEIFYDEARGGFVIFWASTIPGRFEETAGQSEDGYNHRMYYTTTRDFKAFTPTRLLYDPGFSVIDATLLRADDGLRVIIKDETRHPPKKHLRIARAQTATGPFTELADPFTPEGCWVEGPSAVQTEDGWLVYFDCYADGYYGAARSTDLETWEDVTGEVSFPEGARHGTAFAVPASVVEKLRARP